MDEARKPRVLIPPIVIAVFLTWGLWSAGLRPPTGLGSTPELLGILAAGGVALVATGWVLSGATIFFLKIPAWFGWYYECKVSEDTRARMKKALGTEEETNDLVLVTCYGFYCQNIEARYWHVRRMSAVHVNATICLFLTALAVFFLWTFGWLVVWHSFVIVTALFAGVLSRHSWREAMKALEYQTHFRTCIDPKISPNTLT